MATNTRPDICIAVSMLARRVESPKRKDWTEVKRVFRYLKKTKDKKLHLGQKHNTSGLVCYADADWGTTLLIENQIQGTVFSTLAQWYSGKAINKMW